MSLLACPGPLKPRLPATRSRPYVRTARPRAPFDCDGRLRRLLLRVNETISYRLKDSEFAKHWNTSLDKVIEVVCRRISHSKGGKAILVGEICEPAATAAK